MKKMKIPYSKDELNMVAMRLCNTDILSKNKGKIEKLVKKSSLQHNQKEKNKQIAKYHGISISELINSINYKELYSQWEFDRFNRLISSVEGLGFENDQAYAICLALNGSI